MSLLLLPNVISCIIDSIYQLLEYLVSVNKATYHLTLACYNLYIRSVLTTYVFHLLEPVDSLTYSGSKSIPLL